jgi:hypothetical protein
MLQVAKHAKVVFNNRLEIETLEVCANMTGYRSVSNYKNSTFLQNNYVFRFLFIHCCLCFYK